MIDYVQGSGDMNDLFDNFIFVRILFIIIITLIGMGVIDDLKKKDKIRIEKYLSPKKINISLLLEYLFLTFIIRIVLEQLIKRIKSHLNIY